MLNVQPQKTGVISVINDYDAPILLTEIDPYSVSEWGTFKDSLKAPIHGWFTYPAGFSYKAVEHSLKQANLKVAEDTVYDPFMGSGTTNIVAKMMGYNSAGIEAHPFVYPITKTKMQWDLDHGEINNAVQEIHKNLITSKQPKNIEEYLKKQFPELILKCFLYETLFDLLIIRNSVFNINCSIITKEFLKTALICVLRDVSIVATGWPYIAPNKPKITSKSKNPWDVYSKRVYKMLSDVSFVKANSYKADTEHKILLGDSRNTKKQIAEDSINHIFTSPPYLNNFDYADRTRLEMYFMGEASSWGEISQQVRTKLITSATTQINRSDTRYEFSQNFKNECVDVHGFLANAVNQLSERRLVKGGKKSYDLMTIGYFNDMYNIIKDNFRVLKDGSKAVYILGDSAPYGVHIPTDILIGKIGKSIGFKDYKIDVLRVRGGKWASNPQRHTVPLKESIVTLYK